MGRFLVLIILALACITFPSTAGAFNQPDDFGSVTGSGTPGSPLPAAAAESPGTADPAGPQVVRIGTYILDVSNYDPRDGTFDASFYVTLDSDRPVNTTDFEMMNGQAQTMGMLTDIPNRKYFRVFAKLEADPDFHRFPFDRHVLRIVVEPRVKNTDGMVLLIDGNATGLDPFVKLPGWEFGRTEAYILNHTYAEEETPYSRAVFSCEIERDTLSTFLKFFLPVMLIIIVSLSSLMMKVSSRLGLNASMFLAAVLIHWRIADSMPMVGYATFLDYFMIITYATLVMVLLSGILIMRYNEAKDTAMVDAVSRWSIRVIPAVSLVLYALLFLTLPA